MNLSAESLSNDLEIIKDGQTSAITDATSPTKVRQKAL
jgi:hypothetical protein